MIHFLNTAVFGIVFQCSCCKCVAAGRRGRPGKARVGKRLGMGEVGKGQECKGEARQGVTPREVRQRTILREKSLRSGSMVAGNGARDYSAAINRLAAAFVCLQE